MLAFNLIWGPCVFSPIFGLINCSKNWRIFFILFRTKLLKKKLSTSSSLATLPDVYNNLVSTSWIPSGKENCHSSVFIAFVRSFTDWCSHPLNMNTYVCVCVRYVHNNINMYVCMFIWLLSAIAFNKHNVSVNLTPNVWFQSNV